MFWFFIFAKNNKEDIKKMEKNHWKTTIPKIELLKLGFLEWKNVLIKSIHKQYDFKVPISYK